MIRVPLLILIPLTMVAQVDVVTQHNDNARTGANLHEAGLTPERIRNGLGKIGEFQVDGDVYAQPLYVSREHAGRANRDLVIVATMHNSVYAFNADRLSGNKPRKGTPVWKRSLESAVQMNQSLDDWAGDCGPESARNIPLNIRDEIGIVSTPVISILTQTLYVVTFTAGAINGKREYRHYLHALDLATGADRRSAKIEIPGFVSRIHNQRAALLLTGPSRESPNGGVYVAFGSYGDCGNYHGWLFGYDPQTLVRFPTVFETTPEGEMTRGGIWQAGQGPAADDAGNIYVMSGNGGFSPANPDPVKQINYGNSFIKLSPKLAVVDRFTPFNAEALNGVDGDIGSGGPLLIPATNLLVGGGKEGKLYLLNRDGLGGFDPKEDTRIVQSFQATTGQCPQWAENYAKWPYEGCPEPAPAKHADGGYHHIHGSPVYWKSQDGSFIYVWGEADTLRRFKFDSGKFEPAGRSEVITPARSMTGATLSISADESRHGIIWATHPTGCKCDAQVADCTQTKYWCDANENVVPGTLRAIDASSLRELWNSDLDPNDRLGNVAKFAPVTIANGRVYVATFSNKVVAYGLKTSRQRGTTTSQRHGAEPAALCDQPCRTQPTR